MNKENFSLNDEELKEISGGLTDILHKESCNNICSKCGGHVYHLSVFGYDNPRQLRLFRLRRFSEVNGVDQGPHEFSVVGGEEGHCMPAE